MRSSSKRGRREPSLNFAWLPLERKTHCRKGGQQECRQGRNAKTELYASGESLMRNRVLTCSEINSMAPRFLIGSACARYFMASTSRRCPSTYRGSDVRSRRLFPSLGGTVIVKTLAMK